MVDILFFSMGTALSVAAAIEWGLRFREEGFATVLCAGIVAWTGMVVGSQLLLAAFGFMKPILVHATVSIVSLMFLLWIARHRAVNRSSSAASSSSSTDASAAGMGQRTSLDRISWGRIAMTIGVVLLVLPLAETILKESARAPWDGDSLLYHLPLLLDSYIMGHIWSLAPPFGHVPPYAELSGGWWWSGHWHDALMWMQNLGAYLLLAASLVRIMVLLGVRREAGWLTVGIFLIGAYSIERQLGTQETDLWMAAFLIAGLSWCLGSLTSRGERWMAGLALGLAAGGKYQAPFFVVIVLAIALLGRAERGRWRTRTARLLLVALIALSTGCIPYLRNWLVTGNPWYPARIAIFKWVIFAGSSHSAVFGVDHFSALWPFLRDSMEARHLYVQAIPRYLGILPLLGAALAPLVIALRRPRRPALLLFLGALAMIVLTMMLPAFPKKPPGQIPDWLLHGYSMVRYGIAPFSLLVVFVGAGLDAVLALFPWRRAHREKNPGGMRSQRGIAGPLVIGILVSIFSVAVALSPRLIRARELSRGARFQELSGLHRDIREDLRTLNHVLVDRDLIVLGSYPWFFTGEDFSNFLRMPDASFVPLMTDRVKNHPIAYVYLETELSRPSHPGALRGLGIPLDRPPDLRIGVFQIWEK